MPRFPGVVLLFLLAVSLASADEKEPAAPRTVQEAAEAVLEAVEAEDDKALETLAAGTTFDPWLVAEDLGLLGEHDAAAALARVAPGQGGKHLVAYVAARRGSEPRPALRRALAALTRAFERAEWPEVLAARKELDGALDCVARVEAAYVRGRALRSLRRHADSEELLAQAASAARQLGWFRRAADAYHEAGLSACADGDWRTALGAWRARLAAERKLENQEGIGKALNNVGIVHANLGEYDEAVRYYEASLKVTRAIDARVVMASTLTNIGNVQAHRGEYADAIARWEESLRVVRAIDGKPGIARTLSNLGFLRQQMGDYPAALRHFHEALDEAKAQDDQEAYATALNNLGLVHRRLEDEEEAHRLYQESLGVVKRLQNKPGIATALHNLGSIAISRGDPQKALALLEEAREIEQALEDHGAAAHTLDTMGSAHRELGAHDKALEMWQQALEDHRALGNTAGVVRALVGIGIAQRYLGRPALALAAYEEALDLIDRVPFRGEHAHLWWNLATFHSAHERADEAIAAARRGIGHVSDLCAGLAHGEGARARDGYAGLYDVGSHVALHAGRIEDLVWFLEQGRAASLRESLGSRAALEMAVLPDSLRSDLAAARFAERQAFGAYRFSHHRRGAAEARAAREAWIHARDEVGLVARRMEREAKRAAAVALSPTDDLKTIEGHIASGEALVIYGLTPDEAMAVVVRPGRSRIVDLGPPGPIVERAQALLALSERPGTRGHVKRPAAGQAGFAKQIAYLRERLVEPLGLERRLTRVLVCPIGPLAYAPFSLLMPEHEVVFAVSGTTHGVLQAEKGRQGKGVLAIGDPVYAADDRAVRARVRSGLARLPGTRKEVEAIADVHLLGRKATETALPDAIGLRKRWRAVHFACHGLVDPQRPMFSALALTTDEANDGFLTALEVFGMEVPADLVVLSACETGKGKSYRTEGIVGLTRAFMFAGAPRVICSLWKVDDDATQALMIKFYELWNPKNGAKGLSAAAALKKAQAYVRSQEKWAHPFYWAAWVLWGLP